MPGLQSSIVVSIRESTVDACRSALQRVPRSVGWVELRVDELPSAAIPSLVPLAPVPVIVTMRGTAQGGGFGGPLEVRTALYRAVLDAGAAFVDLEWGSPIPDGIDPRRLVVSHHDEGCDLDRLAELFRAMAATPAARLKIVPQARTSVDALRTVRGLLESPGARGRLAAFALGGPGEMTRVLAPAWGSWATYAALGRGRETAAGQLPVGELVEVWDPDGVGRRTRFVALIGNDLSRSPSPAMHNAALRSAGVDARYLRFELPEFAQAETLCSELPLEGLGVTMPFKEIAAQKCVGLDSWARRTGVANTLRRDPSGRFWGWNTDAAAIAALLRAFDARGREAVVVGSGATARSFAAALADAGARVAMVGRDEDRTRHAARAVGAEAWTVDRAAASGAAWWALAVPPRVDLREELPGCRAPVELLFDASYGSPPGRGAVGALTRGARIVDGVALLAEQGIRQLEVLLGVRPSRVSAESIARRHLAGLDVSEPPE